MKYYDSKILLLLLLMPANSFAQSGWSVTPSGVYSRLHSIVFSYLNPPVRYACGDSGTILRSDDFGESWKTLRSGIPGEEYNAIDLPYEDTLLVAGFDGTRGLLRKMYFDGSGNFIVVNLPSPSSARINDMSFHSTSSPEIVSRAGYFVGDSGIIMRTLNLGASSSPQPSPTRRNLHSISFADYQARIFACGDSGTIIRRRSPSQWDIQSTPSSMSAIALHGIFILEDTVWAVGEGGSILHTSNAGVQWLPQNSGVTATLRAVKFLDSRFGFAVGDSGVVVGTLDGGKHWTRLPTGVSSTLYDISIVDSVRAMIVGDSGLILWTHSAGALQPIFSTPDPALEFGRVQVGGTKTGTIPVLNGGSIDMTITEVTSTNPEFEVEPISAVIPPLESRRFYVRFHPSTKGRSYGDVVIKGNLNGSTRSIQVSGTGADPVGRSSWVRQNPLPGASVLYDVKMTGLTSAIAVGDAGTIMRTTDVGVSWTTNQNTQGTLNDLAAVSFGGGDTGFVVGNFGAMLRTTDNGQTWATLESGTTKSLRGVALLGNGVACAVGVPSPGELSGAILRTTDNGNSWNDVFRSPRIGLVGIAFADERLGFAVGGSTSNVYFAIGVMFRTTDGGAHWVTQTIPQSNYLTSIAFGDSDHGVATGLGGTLLSTSDGGNTWSGTSIGSSTNFTRVTFNGPSQIAILQSDGRTLVSHDGGAIWKVTPELPGGLYFSHSYTVGGTGLAVGAHLIAGGSQPLVRATINAGTRVEERSHTVTSRNLRAVTSPNLKTTIVAGDSGTILRTTDAGTTWVRQLAGTLFEKSGLSITGISFTDTNTGTAVGWQGLIIRTTDGGSDWTIQESGVNADLTSVSFVDSEHGFAAGSGGTIVHTSNGGVDWINQSPGYPNALTAISAIDPNTATIVGGNGIILRTGDGGIHWTSQTSNTTQYLRSVSFMNDHYGSAVGDNGTILRTTDGGMNWVVQNAKLDTIVHFYGVRQTDQSIATIVGTGGRILRTTDGGATWDLQSSGTFNRLTAVGFSDENTATIVGDGGLILHTTSGGADDVAEYRNMPSLPASCSLSQNYPNPFNPKTVIGYSLSVTSDVSLMIIDVLGRQVATIVEGVQRPGEYKVSWDADKVPSGVYFYRLTAGRFTEVKKMLLMK